MCVDSDEKQALAGDIMAYLVNHPEAQDTVEGITEWWLLEQKIRKTASEVKAALGTLVAKKKVKQVHRQDGRIYYRLLGDNPGRCRRNIGSDTIT
jgi:hypothetical protein